MTVKLSIPGKEAALIISDMFWEQPDSGYCCVHDKLKFIRDMAPWFMEYNNDFIKELAKNLILEGQEGMISEALQERSCL